MGKKGDAGYSSVRGKQKKNCLQSRVLFHAGDELAW
jgi:hypothetical protein